MICKKEKAKILITGSSGFIGKNLAYCLKALGYEVIEFDRTNDMDFLEKGIAKCDFIFHCAGINRSNNKDDFFRVNATLTENIIKLHSKCSSSAKIIMTSSTHAQTDSPYGKSKKTAEDMLIQYSKASLTTVAIYRLTNVFGKWSRPNYNSVVATFCYNIARGLPVEIHDKTTDLSLIYIDDIIKKFICDIENPNLQTGYYEISPVYNVILNKLMETIIAFKQSRLNHFSPNTSDEFTNKLWATYLSYLPKDDFVYDLKMNVDERGSFTEFLKDICGGQVAVNISKPNIIKGNHWHNTKNEKFLVVLGEGLIKLREVSSNDIVEYRVSGKKLMVVDIPPGYTHNIENIGCEDMITIIWANEIFKQEKPDTYALEV